MEWVARHAGRSDVVDKSVKCLDDSSKQPLSASRSFFRRKLETIGKIWHVRVQFNCRRVYLNITMIRRECSGGEKMQRPDNEAEFPFLSLACMLFGFGSHARLNRTPTRVVFFLAVSSFGA